MALSGGLETRSEYVIERAARRIRSRWRRRRCGYVLPGGRLHRRHDVASPEHDDGDGVPEAPPVLDVADRGLRGRPRIHAPPTDERNRMIPTWLTGISIASIAICVLCALWVAVDVVRHPPHMKIMAAVWPLTALFGGPLLVWFYRRHGRGKHGDTPFPIAVAKGALHCGAGCALGDIIAESAAALWPVILAAFGYPGLFPDSIFAAWSLDFVIAFAFGIVFQYFAIAPMRDLSVGRGIIEAVKADTLSLISWQIGMYGGMAIARFWLFGSVLHAPLEASEPSFWLMMQLAMLAGFVTAYPTNWMLIRKGIKEQM